MKALELENMEQIEGGRKPLWCKKAWADCLLRTPDLLIPFWNVGVVAGCSIGLVGCGK